MSNNISKHISDKSVDKTFDPTGTDFPADAVNVQVALSKIGGYALKATGLPKSSDNIEGIIRCATQAEVTAGTADTLAVTPKTLAMRLGNPLASETVVGYTRYATNVEAFAGTANDCSITPAKLKYMFDNKKATEVVYGSAIFSSDAAAKAGVDNTTVMTPKKVALAIAALVPPAAAPATATEARQGYVQLATWQQTQAGTLKDAYAISPYAFSRAVATTAKTGVVKLASSLSATGTEVITGQLFNTSQSSESAKGLIRIATSAEAKAGTLSNVAITPKTLKESFVEIPTSSESIKGIIQIASGNDFAQSNNTRALTCSYLKKQKANVNSAGIIEVATQSEVNAGGNTLDAVTPSTLRQSLQPVMLFDAGHDSRGNFLARGGLFNLSQSMLNFTKIVIVGVSGGDNIIGQTEVYKHTIQKMIGTGATTCVIHEGGGKYSDFLRLHYNSATQVEYVTGHWSKGIHQIFGIY